MIGMKKTYASGRGQAMVEFAIVLPLLVALTFGIIEFGVFLYNQQVITNASREGARRGIVSGLPRVQVLATSPPDLQNPSITDVVNTYCTGHMRTFGAANVPSVTVTGYSPNAAFGNPLTVTVRYQYTFLIFSRTPRQMTASTVMNYE